MNRAILPSAVLLTSVFAATPASASYMARCTLQVSVVSVPDSGEAQPAASWVRAVFKVDRVLAGGGHSSTHCRNFPQQGPFDAVLRAENAEVVGRVKAGTTWIVKYRYASARGGQESTSWTVASRVLDVEAPLLERCSADPSLDVCGIGGRGPVVLAASPDGNSVLRWDIEELASCGDGPFSDGNIGLVSASVKAAGLETSKRFEFEVPGRADAAP